MKIIEAFIREPAVLVVALLFLAGIGLPIMDAFSKAITDTNGRRRTIFRRCLAGEAPLWVVYWLFGIVGGVLTGLISLFAATFSPTLGMVLMAVYATWWVASLWQCARNAEYEIFTYLARGLLVVGLLGFLLPVAGMVALGGDIPSSLLTGLSLLLAIQFVLVYIAAYTTGFAATGTVTHRGSLRMSREMLRGMYRIWSSDTGVQETRAKMRRRENEDVRLQKELGDIADYKGDGHGIRR